MEQGQRTNPVEQPRRIHPTTSHSHRTQEDHFLAPPFPHDSKTIIRTRGQEGLGCRRLGPRVVAGSAIVEGADDDADGVGRRGAIEGFDNVGLRLWGAGDDGDAFLCGDGFGSPHERCDGVVPLQGFGEGEEAGAA